MPEQAQENDRLPSLQGVSPVMDAYLRGVEKMTQERTQFSFDLPDERVITFSRLIPVPHRDDVIELNGESRTVRSATLVVDSTTGAVSLYVRLR